MQDKYIAIAQFSSKPVDKTYTARGKSMKCAVKRLANQVPTHFGKSYPYVVYHLTAEGLIGTIAKDYAGK